jgi:hypothetical protein
VLALALARAGATEEAARRFDAHALGGIEDEDVAALRARIAKDAALSRQEPERRRPAARAAELHGAIHARPGVYSPLAPARRARARPARARG